MVQEITSRSWTQRILSALWGVLLGMAFMMGAMVLVFWNEGNGLLMIGFGRGLIAFIGGLGLWVIGLLVIVAGICYLFYRARKRVQA